MKYFIGRLLGIVLFAGLSGCSSGAKELPPSTEPGDKPSQETINEEIKKSMERGGYDKRRGGGKLPPSVDGK